MEEYGTRTNASVVVAARPRPKRAARIFILHYLCCVLAKMMPLANAVSLECLPRHRSRSGTPTTCDDCWVSSSCRRQVETFKSNQTISKLSAVEARTSTSLGNQAKYVQYGTQSSSDVSLISLALKKTQNLIRNAKPLTFVPGE